MVNIDFTNVMKHKTDYLSRNEILTMLNWCYDNDQMRDYMLIMTLSRTGRRISEIVGSKPYIRNVGLRPCDIHEDGLIEWDILKKNHVKTFDKKGKKVLKDKLHELKLKKLPKRALKPADDEYIDLLKSYIEINGIKSHQRVFPITRQRADWLIKRIAKACNISRSHSHIHCHNFRHSLTINMLKAHPNNPNILLYCQKVLDHSSIQVTSHYAQFTQFDIKQALNETFRGD